MAAWNPGCNLRLPLRSAPRPAVGLGDHRQRGGSHMGCNLSSSVPHLPAQQPKAGTAASLVCMRRSKPQLEPLPRPPGRSERCARAGAAVDARVSRTPEALHEPPPWMRLSPPSPPANWLVRFWPRRVMTSGRTVGTAVMRLCCAAMFFRPRAASRCGMFACRGTRAVPASRLCDGPVCRVTGGG